ncbi:hypothetical protein SDJN03_09304, partial [Cucurbita argyrosperma subsp. sororia]
MRRRNGLGLGLDSVVELETQRPRNSNSNRYVAGSSNLFDAHLRFLSLPAGVCAISSPITRNRWSLVYGETKDSRRPKARAAI